MEILKAASRNLAHRGGDTARYIHAFTHVKFSDCIKRGDYSDLNDGQHAFCFGFSRFEALRDLALVVLARLPILTSTSLPSPDPIQ